MRICGIDPSLTGTGVAHIINGKPLQPLRIGYKGVAGASDVDRARRVVALVREVTKAVRQHQPNIVLIESPAYSKTMGSTTDRHFLWGALVHEFGVVGPMAYAGITPTGRAQFGCGKGHDAKELIIESINLWWDLNLRLTPKTRMQDNEADAMTMATMGLARYEPELLPFDLAKHQIKNLEAVQWPEFDRTEIRNGRGEVLQTKHRVVRNV